MSSYYDTAIHPVTGQPTRCMYLDNYFGRHRYGVRFEGEEHVYPATEVRRAPPTDEPPAPERG